MGIEKSDLWVKTEQTASCLVLRSLEESEVRGAKRLEMKIRFNNNPKFSEISANSIQIFP